MKPGLVKLLIGLVVLLCVGLVFRFTSLSEVLSPEQLALRVSSFGPLAPLFFVGVYAIASVAFLPGTPLTLLGGVLFGPIYGALYVLIGATLGAVGAFLTARYFGSSIFAKSDSDLGRRLANYNERLANHGFLTVVFLRLVPLFPFNGLNFALGLTEIRLRDYFLGTFIGIIPGTVALVYFGDSLASLDLVKIVVALIILLLLTFGGKWVIKKYGHK